MSRALEEFKDIYSDFLDRSHSAIVDGYWHLKENRHKFDLKKEDFNHIQNTSEAVLEGLKVLLDSVEGDRNKPGVQPYINKVVGSINKHLERIHTYYPKNKPSGFKTKESKREETKFQQLVFKGEQKIRSQLRDLNVENDMASFSFEFYNDVKATLPFKDILSKRFPNIAAKIESLKIDWDLIIDNSLHIHKKKRNVPEWKDNLHFWDQEEETLQYWVSEYNKIKKGITIDGQFISPWLYYHINFFKTPIGDENDEILTPQLRDNEWYLCEILNYVQKQIDEKKDGGLAIMGTRRYGKSTGEASWSCHTIVTNPSKNGVISSSAEKDILALTDKVDVGLTHLPLAFRLPINSKEWTKQVRFGLKTKTAQEIKYFYLDIINIDGGSKRGSQKLAGIAPILFVMDEFAKEKFIDAYNALIPALETNKGWKTIPWFTATGGDEDLSTEAEKALSDPKSHRFVNMNWDILNKMVPEKYRTWKERNFGFFIPAQMGQRTGHEKISTKLSDFLGVKSKELDSILIEVTNWELNTKVCLDKRKELASDKKQQQKEIVYYPLDPEECFMSAKNNPFPAQVAKKQKERVVSEYGEKGSGRHIELYRDENNPQKIKFNFSDKDVVKFAEQKGGFKDAPFIIYGNFPESPPEKFRFIAGFDDYKYEESSGDSVGSFYIFDRLERKIVLSLATRPDPHRSLHSQVHMALDAYNCLCFPENADLDIKKYFDRLHMSDYYLAKGFDVMSKFNLASNGKRKYGWTPDKFSTPFVLGLVIEYCKEETDILDNEDNVAGTKLGVEAIEDLELLEEIIKYKDSGNFDRIVAFGSCLFYDHYLSSNFIFPKNPSQKNKKEVPRTKPTPRNKTFGNARRRTF